MASVLHFIFETDPCQCPNQSLIRYPELRLGNNAPRAAGQPTPAQELRRNLSAYEWVWMKYVVAAVGDDNPLVEAISSQTTDGLNQPLLLRQGQSATGVLPANIMSRAFTINGIGVMLGNYGNTSTGLLKVTVCGGGSDCAGGAADLATSHDNSVFYIPLESPLRLAADAPVRYTFTLEGSGTPVALWAYPAVGAAYAQNLVGPAGALPGKGLQVHLCTDCAMADAARLVYSDELMNIFELPDPKPYFEVAAGRCTVEAHGRDQATLDCVTPATLVRHELFFPDWTASVDGTDTPLAEYQGLFQAVSLPQGKSELRYSYAPPHINWAWSFMLLGLGILFLSGFTRSRYDLV